MAFLFLYVFGTCVSFIQLLLLRETMPVFQSIDIVGGFFAFHSVIGFSAGLFAASKLTLFQRSQKTIFFCCIALIAVFFLDFAFIRSVRSLLSVSAGGGISLKTAFVCVFAAAAPLNFIAGSIAFFASYAKKGLYRSFVLQSLGFISGCAAYSFFAVQSAGLFAALIAAAALSASLFLISSGKKSVIFAACLSVFFVCAAKGLLFDVSAADKKLLEGNFISSGIKDYKHTSYGQNVLTQKNGELSFFANQILMFSKPDIDILESEDFGHIPALHHPALKKVLIIGGAVKYLPMIFKHDVDFVDCVEADEAAVLIARKNFLHLGYIFKNERLRIHNLNARDFIENSVEKYDLILVGMPYPLNLQLNSYYTEEFFRSASRHLGENGFVAVKLPGRTAFSSYIMAELNKSVLDAMQSVFKHTQIIPGSSNILIASKSRMPYRLHIKKRLAKMQETTLILSKYYLDDRMDTLKTRWLKNELKKVKKSGLLNSDFNPGAVMQSVLYGQSGFSPYLSVFLDEAAKYSYLVLIAAAIVFFLSKSVYNATSFVCFATSFWLMFTAAFSMQIYNGQIYKWSGIIAALFASGILSGSFVPRIFAKHIPLNKKMFSAEMLFVFTAALWFSAVELEAVNPLLLSVFTFLSGFAAGAEFFILTRIAGLFGSESKTKLYLFAVSGILFSLFAGGSFLILSWGISKGLAFIFFLKFLIFCRWADLSRRGL